MQDRTSWQIAAKQLFRRLSGGNGRDDEYMHGYAEVKSYDDFWSNHSNSTMLEILTEFCEHFGIDETKLQQFTTATIKCDYCGENNAPTKDKNGEHVCEECLRKMEEKRP